MPIFPFENDIHRVLGQGIIHPTNFSQFIYRKSSQIFMAKKKKKRGLPHLSRSTTFENRPPYSLNHQCTTFKM